MTKAPASTSSPLEDNAAHHAPTASAHRHHPATTSAARQEFGPGCRTPDGRGPATPGHTFGCSAASVFSLRALRARRAARPRSRVKLLASGTRAFFVAALDRHDPLGACNGRMTTPPIRKCHESRAARGAAMQGRALSHPRSPSAARSAAPFFFARPSGATCHSPVIHGENFWRAALVSRFPRPATLGTGRESACGPHDLLPRAPVTLVVERD